MKYGFLRVAAASSSVVVADCEANANCIIELAFEAKKAKAELVVFPELCVTAYTCGDLFHQRALIESAKSQLAKIAARTNEAKLPLIVGAPVSVGSSLYNCAAVLFGGRVVALIPKSYIPEYSEFYEKRQFSSGLNCAGGTLFFDEENPAVPFGRDVLIADKSNPLFVLACEICEDLWVPCSPSLQAAVKGGALIIANLSASNEIIGKADYRRLLVASQSAKLCSAYIYANATAEESSTDLVFSAHNLIGENGTILAESKTFQSGIIYADVDLERLCQERKRMTTFSDGASDCDRALTYRKIALDLGTKESKKTASFSLPAPETNAISRFVDPRPFVPSAKEARKIRCEEVCALQSRALAKRLSHTKAQSAVIGLSGGLDSTLALLITIRAFGILKIQTQKIIAVTMPCFGTSGRTLKNARSLANQTGATLKEINITQAVRLHFNDIGQDENTRDTTYENCQARERTQILMDIANKTGGLVIGTGDLSELALGWATYNGDHMSMYAVNSSIPKTLVRYLVEYFRDEFEAQGDSNAAQVLTDILDTPVSPELLPPEDGGISQKTEQIVGPYELHDFFLYYVLRFGFTPEKIFFLARQAFADEYSAAQIKHWLISFYKRFFSQQFKRSCVPDGAKIGTVNLSPRGDWRMPSDASGKLWITQAEKIDV